MWFARFTVSSLALVLAAGCTGVVGDPPSAVGSRTGDGVGGAAGATGGNDMPGAPGGTRPAACALRPPAAAPLRMLTPTEYDNTVRDLLGDATRPAGSWPPPPNGSGFDNDAAGQSTTEQQIDLMIQTAEAVAAAAVTRPLQALLGCEQSDAGCPDAFIDRFARRCFRRPVTDADRTLLRGAFDLGKAAGTFADGIRVVVQTALLSPHFLYRPEVSGRDGALTDHEIASRLSYFLWNTMPDEALLAAADAGQLHTVDQVRTQATRMLSDVKARESLANFHRQWLYLDRVGQLRKSAALIADFGPDVTGALVASTTAFLQDAFLSDGSADLGTLLTARYGFATSRTAPLLGATVPAGTMAPVRVSLDPQQRAGLLTDPTLLATLAKPDETAPVLRGQFVREHLLCQPVSPPPPTVDQTPPPVDPNKTTRERWAALLAPAGCAGCHSLMNPIGFGFEAYDAVGRFRTTENGKPIDATGELIGTGSADGKFDGAVELAHRLAASDDLAACLSAQWFTYAAGRANGDDDACALADIGSRFAESGFKLRELLLAIVTDASFSTRPVLASGGCQ